MPPLREDDPLLDIEYERGQLKRFRVGRCGARVLMVLSLLVTAAFATGERARWLDVLQILMSAVKP